jgi:hypothetical protein
MRMFLSILIALNLVLLSVDAGHWECTDDSECPMYHWCHRIYQGFSTVGR